MNLASGNIPSVNEVVTMARAKAQNYHPLNGAELMTQIENSLAKEPVLLALHEQIDGGLVLAHHCLSNNFPPVLMQLLSEQLESSSHTAHQTMLSTWLATMIAKVSGLSTEKQHEIFCASLLKDISFNYLGHELANETKPTPQQWQLINIHPLVSAKLVDSENYFDKNVITAIMQHHERVDHSGFPKGSVGVIPMTSKIVSLGDQLYRIVRDQSPMRYYRLLAYLRINKDELADNVINPTIALFKQSKANWGDAELPASSLKKKLDLVGEATTLLNSFSSDTKALHETLNHIQYALHQAGLNHVEFLSQQAGTLELGERIELNALTTEWFWLFKRFIRAVKKKEPSHELLQQLQTCHDDFFQIT